MTFDLGNQCALALLLTIVLMLGIPARRNTALEVRRKRRPLRQMGRPRLDGRAVLRPLEPDRRLPVGAQELRRNFEIRRRTQHAHHRQRRHPAGTPSDSLTAAVGQFVPVYDHDGALLAEPDREQRKARWIPWRDLDRPPLQFDLQTLLLLVVVVASFAGLFSLHYHSPKYQAIRRLEAFDPIIGYNADGEVWRINFSTFAKKPTNDDLVCLEPLSELEFLDLGGLPITDAGLVHLKGLKKLSHVNLANTHVTEAGMEDLRLALPKASIAKRVEWIPPKLVPIYSPPVKKKRP